MKKKFLFFALRFIVSFSLIGWLLLRLGKENLQNFPLYFKQANYTLLGLAVLIFSFAVLITAIRWQILLRVQGIKLSFSPICKLTYIGFFFSNFLPTVVGGDVVKLVYVIRHTKKGPAPLASMLLDRALGVGALVIISLVAVSFTLQVPQIKEIAPPIIVFCLLILSLFFLLLYPKILASLALTVLFVLLFIGNPTISPLMIGAGIITLWLFLFLVSSPNSPVFKIKLLSLGEKFRKLYDAVSLYRENKKTLFFCLILSLLVQNSLALITYLISLAFNLNIPIVYFFLFYPLICLIMSLPISIAGLGLRESAFIFFFTILENTSQMQMDAFALGLCFYLVTLVTSSVGGIIYSFTGGEIKKISAEAESM